MERSETDACTELNSPRAAEAEDLGDAGARPSESRIEDVAFVLDEIRSVQQVENFTEHLQLQPDAAVAKPMGHADVLSKEPIAESEPVRQRQRRVGILLIVKRDEPDEIAGVETTAKLVHTSARQQVIARTVAVEIGLAHINGERWATLGRHSERYL